MNIEFTVKVALSRDSGKFASKDEVATYIAEAIEAVVYEGADGVGPDGETYYVTDDVTVEVVS